MAAKQHYLLFIFLLLAAGISGTKSGRFFFQQFFLMQNTNKHFKKVFHTHT